MKEIGGAAAFGILLGVLVGLSTSPTVGALVTGLVGVLMTLRPNREPGATTSPSLTHLGAFSVLCLVGIILGIATRTHSWLSPSLASQRRQWIEAEFPADIANLVVLHGATGLVKDGWTATENGTKNSILYAIDLDSTARSRLNPRNLESVSHIITRWRNHGLPWSAFANVFETAQGLADEQKKTALTLAFDAITREEP